eukprot:Gb_16917 [translate_table: standard]
MFRTSVNSTMGQMFNFPLPEGFFPTSMGMCEKLRNSQIMDSETHPEAKIKFAPTERQNWTAVACGIGLQHKQENDSFEPSDFLVLEDESDESSKAEAEPQKPVVKTEPTAAQHEKKLCSLSSSASSIEAHQSENSILGNHKASEASSKKKNKRKPERAVRYAFKTKSDSDILEDGYKWRKYGKKFVKNSPNPRNYYRCSDSKCDVKKRVERDAKDPGIVITTYEGKHNHESPSVIYYIGNPILVPHESSLDQFSQLCAYPAAAQKEFMFLNMS